MRLNLKQILTPLLDVTNMCADNEKHAFHTGWFFMQDVILNQLLNNFHNNNEMLNLIQPSSLVGWSTCSKPDISYLSYH